MGLLSKIENIHSIYDTFIHFMKQFDSEDYPACALRALGLILTDNALTVGRGKIFWRVSHNSGTKSPDFSLVSPRAKKRPLTKIGVVWQISDFLAKNRDFCPKKKLTYEGTSCSGHDRKKLFTLFGPRGGGTLCPPCHIFVYICANKSTSALKKLDFSQLWVWKRVVHFLPRQVISFCWKKMKFVGNTKIS